MNSVIIRLTQGKSTIVDAEDYNFLNQWKWQYCTRYASRKVFIATINGKQKFRKISMHRLIIDAPDGSDVDHINGNPLDNRRSNLRLCTKAENHQNSHRRNQGKTSKYKGVSFHKKNQNWVAQIQPNKEKIYLGSFDSEHDAATAYNMAALRYFRQFAFLNEIPYAA